MSEKTLTQRALRAWAEEHPDQAEDARRIADNLSLSRIRRVTKRRRQPREALDLAPGIARMLGGLARRGEEGDLDALLALRHVETELSAAMRICARGLKDFGHDWPLIGEHIGITRQAARQRWGA